MDELDVLDESEEATAETAAPGKLEASQGAVRVLLAAVEQLVAENMELNNRLTEALGAGGVLEIVEADGSVTEIAFQAEAAGEEVESDVASDFDPMTDAAADFYDPASLEW